MEQGDSMASHFRKVVLTALAGLVISGGIASTASATDFCTSLTDPGCPAGAVAINPDANPATPADIDTAMETNGKDGQPDRVFIGAGTHMPPGGDGFYPNDITLTDDLEVIGAGRDQTVLTTTSSGNIYLMDLNQIGARKVTVRDLTLRIPESFPDSGGYGAALQSNGDDFVRVDFVSRNPVNGHSGTAAAGNVIYGGEFRDVRMYGENGGGFGSAFGTSNWSDGDALVIEDSDIRGFQWGVTYISTRGMPVRVVRSRMKSEYGSVIESYNGGSGSPDTFSTIENSIIEGGETAPVIIGALSGSSAGINLTVRNSTMLNLGGAPRAFGIQVSGSAPGDANLKITDSIVFGFEKSWVASAPTGADGDVNIEVRYSNIENPGTLTGDGVVETSVGNISETPLFADMTDYRLSPESPSVDAGDPAPGGLTADIEGNVRPQDGNGDGTKVRDQGAYELAEAATCETDPALCPGPPPGDTVAPRITRVKFKAPRKKPGQLRLTLSEPAALKVTFKPTPKGKGRKKRKVVKLSKPGKAGLNKLKIRKGKLKAGRYRLTIVAIDPAGNRSKLVKKVRMKAKKA